MRKRLWTLRWSVVVVAALLFFGVYVALLDNVIITPHSAFYSTTAIEDLERLSCENIVHFLKGEKEKVFKLVNEV